MGYRKQVEVIALKISFLLKGLEQSCQFVSKFVDTFYNFDK